MSSETAIGFDFGATTIKTGVVRDGVILTKGNVIETRQDGNTDALVTEILKDQHTKGWFPRGCSGWIWGPGDH